jgi:pSer/pThr/pTyr-binding forkhead associated (FHA) protein
MEKRREQAQPALTLLYGSAEEKRWLLNQDVATLGRAKGCDIVLEAADISSLHCLVWAFQGGYLVRDCGSRAGTQLNGDRVNQATLHDGDILQVGPFSFRLTLPSKPRGGKDERTKHLERSRRNLGRLAWIQRKKLLAMQQVALGDSGPALQDLKQKASGLRVRFRDYEKRSRLLEQGERELSQDREAFNQERKDHLAKLKESAEELNRRQQEMQTDLEARRQELLKQEKAMTETRNHQSQASALLEQQRQDQEQAEKSLR